MIFDNAVIGTTDLAHRDESMGVLHGEFSPTSEYERVRSVFRMFTEGSESNNEGMLLAYFAARDALGLGVESEDGTVLPAATVHVTDFSDEIGEYEITVWTADVRAFQAHD